MDATHYKTLLEARLSELDGRLHGIESELESHNSRDWEDGAIEREGDEALEALGTAGQTEILMVQAALGRIADGSFGYCQICGDTISEERLNVLPSTPFCRKCAR